MDISLQAVWSGVRAATVTGTRFTKHPYRLGVPSWNNAVINVCIILYSDTAVAIGGNRGYWEKAV